MEKTDAEPYSCRVMHPDVPGEFCFPPLASLITAGARLMLSLLEHCVSELGGTYVMEDTDSMAIVATEDGGLVRCPGGPLEMRDGHSAVRALSWAQVEQIADRFATLNPSLRRARACAVVCHPRCCCVGTPHGANSENHGCFSHRGVRDLVESLPNEVAGNGRG
jgi:hypothetical protein